jgi:hypothetical protein
MAIISVIIRFIKRYSVSEEMQKRNTKRITKKQIGERIWEKEL